MTMIVVASVLLAVASAAVVAYWQEKRVHVRSIEEYDELAELIGTLQRKNRVLVDELTDRQRKYHELPKIDDELFRQWIIGLANSDFWTYLVDTYLHKFVADTGRNAQSGNVNAELMNVGKIQAVIGLAGYVDKYVQAIRMQNQIDSEQDVIDE